MALPESYLMPTELEPFLFALIGPQVGGAQLTVLSALARHGLDPWDEADQLSKLPKGIATKRLLAVMTTLPTPESGASSVAELASRLVDLLPRGERGGQGKPASASRQPPLPVWLILMLMAVAALMIWY